MLTEVDCVVNCAKSIMEWRCINGTPWVLKGWGAYNIITNIPPANPRGIANSQDNPIACFILK